MHRLQFVVDGVCHQFALALGVGAPQQEHHGGILKRFPFLLHRLCGQIALGGDDGILR